MQIEIRTAGVDLSDQRRAYIEYRVFSAVRRFAGQGGTVDVRLEDRGSRKGARYVCTATAVFVPDGRVRVASAAEELQTAIERAADQLSGMVHRHLAGRPGGSGRSNETSCPEGGRAKGGEREP